MIITFSELTEAFYKKTVTASQLIFTQLELANDAVEYVSWITASILAVIAVLTIFLTHLFQNHTLEMQRLNEKLRDRIEQKDVHEVAHLLRDIDFVGRVHPVIEKSVKISKNALRILIPVWIVSGLSFSEKLLQAEQPYPFIGISLIITGTSLFVYFTLNLIRIVSMLERDDGIENYVTKKTEFNDLKSLSDKDFSLASVLEINEIEFTIELVSSEPFVHVETNNPLLLTNFSPVLNLYVNKHRHFYIGEKFTGPQSKEINWVLPDNWCHSLRRMIVNAKSQPLECYISFIVDQKIFSFGTSIKVEEEDEIQILKIKTAEFLNKSQYSLPKDVILKLSSTGSVYQ